MASRGVDIELAKIIKDRAEKSKIIFKENPIDRVRQTAGAMWAVEDVKIKLSEAIRNSEKKDDTYLKKIKEEITLPAGTFHMEEEVISFLTGYDLKEIITRLWHRFHGQTLIKCHSNAEKKLEEEITHYDYVLLAGGSAQLPFLEELVRKTLSTQMRGTKIVSGNYIGAAVAKGIAAECQQQADRKPSLVNDKLASCFLSDLYLTIGRRKDEKIRAKIKSSNSVSANADGLVYRKYGLLEDTLIKCKIEFRYKLSGALHFWFHSSPDNDKDPLNPISSIRIPAGNSVDKKIDVELKIEEDGTITPTFTFWQRGKNPKKTDGQPFNLGSKTKASGQLYLGVDFGTCNSYVAKYISQSQDIEQASYPQYQISPETQARLLKIEKRCKEIREQGFLDKSSLIKHAQANELDFIFHSNKIEGNKLTRGETLGTLKAKKISGMSKDEKEAINLRDSYRLVLENHGNCTNQFSAFVREVNKNLLLGIEKNSGGYRTEDVSIAGVSYKPPPWGSVEDFMKQLSDELKTSEAEASSGLELAVRAHTKLVAIHPFIDGNGRTARLLMAAILLSYQLPVLVLNADDKERYLHALGFSNEGSLDALIVLFVEILEQTLQDFISSPETAIKQQDETFISDKNLHQPDKRRTKPETIVDGKARGRLISILEEKRKERKEVQKATYPAWQNAFQMFRNELAAYVENLDSMEDFQKAGYEIKFSIFDMINEDTFDAYWTRREVSNTWFCTITVFSPFETSSLMFQFARCSEKLRTIEPAIAPVTCKLAIGGEDTGAWLPLREEPIKLREIGYANGSLIYMDYNDSFIVGGVSDILDDLIADLIEA